MASVLKSHQKGVKNRSKKTKRGTSVILMRSGRVLGRVVSGGVMESDTYFERKRQELTVFLGSQI